MFQHFHQRGFQKIMLVILVAVTILILGSIFASLSEQKKTAGSATKPPANSTRPEMPQMTVVIAGQELKAYIADNAVLRSRGLSDWSGLNQGEAMLFVFAVSGNYGFWMKDMNFPIDIAWFDVNGRLVHLESNVAPTTYPQNFGGHVVAKYVLETTPGFFESHQIKLGATLSVVGQLKAN